MKKLLMFALTGAVAGFVNGLFGTGGALPLLALFSYLSLSTDKAFATANITAMTLSVISFAVYMKNGALPEGFLPDFVSGGFLPALLGGAAGSLLLSKISPNLLKKIFCIITVIGGVGVVLK